MESLHTIYADLESVLSIYTDPERVLSIYKDPESVLSTYTDLEYVWYRPYRSQIFCLVLWRSMAAMGSMALYGFRLFYGH